MTASARRRPGPGAPGARSSPRRWSTTTTTALRILVPLALYLPGAAAGDHHFEEQAQKLEQRQQPHQQQQRVRDLAYSYRLDANLLPEGFSLRYPSIFESAPSPAHLARRDGQCGANKHDCLDIGHPERCCTNDTYCYVSRDGLQPKCCPIGSNCVEDTPCSSNAFYCVSTFATTSIHTMTVTGSAAAAAATPSPSVLEGCCQRACPQTSFYLCAKSLGGNCCPFGSDCQAGGNCVSTKTAGAMPRETPQKGGACATDQIRCDDGNGCCDAAAVCTQFQGGAFCASQMPRATPESTISFGGPTATPEGASTAGSSSSGNGAEADAAGGSGGGGGSSGRIIGLAVGLSLGLSLVLGLIAWRLLLVYRRRRAESALVDSEPKATTPSDPDTSTGTGTVASPMSPSDQAPEPVFPPDVVELPVTHEPNGPDAEPVEIDSTEVMEAAPSQHDEFLSPLSPLSSRSENEKSPSFSQGHKRVSSLSAAAKTESWAVTFDSPSEP